jgi:hypothetical protein
MRLIQNILKKIIVATILLFLIISCKNRDTKETRLLIKGLVTEESNKNIDTIFIVNQAKNDWIKKANLDSCNLGDLIMNNKLKLGTIKSGNFKPDFLTKSDYEKLCNESMKAFLFKAMHIPNNVSLVPNEYIHQLIEEFKVNWQTPKIGTIAWYSFSKPVFFQNYRYAFVYYERFTISSPMVSGGTALVFCEKDIDGKWKVIFSQMLLMA